MNRSLLALYQWIASDGEMMTRFLGLTGIEPDQIREVASEPGFLAAVLDFLLAHEPTLNRFCEENNVEPKFVAQARKRFGDLSVPGPEITSGFCRDCMTPRTTQTRRCAKCGSPRAVSHAEIDQLSIAHIDCDAFYASVEKRDNPELRDKPVIVGGGKRGVVSTCCYIARTYGVRSAMPAFKALKLCPHAVVVKPRMHVYANVGKQIRTMMEDLTPAVEPISIDEAFLDLTGTEKLHRDTPARTLAKFAKRVENEIGISVSVGLSYCKYLAKIASDFEKPRGFSVIGEAEALSFLADKPVKMIWGVGPAFEKSLHRDGITLIGQLQQMDENTLLKRYGVMGSRLFKLSRGIDHRTIKKPSGGAKSVSHETTFNEDYATADVLVPVLRALSEKVSARLKYKNIAGRTVVLKLKDKEFKSITRSKQVSNATQLADKIFRTALGMLEKELDGTQYRLLGVGVSDFVDAERADPMDLIDVDATRRAEAERAMDHLKEKYGEKAVETGYTFGKGNRGGTLNIDDNQNLVEEALEKSESMFRSPRMFDDNANAVTGVITWAPAKSIWFSSMALSAIILGPIYFTWGAFFLFIGSTAVTICLGHSVGMHRLLIHRSYACSLFIERLFVYLGTVVGMAGPTGIIQQHDIRDWAQRQPKCHAFLSHQSGILRDFFWQLHCNIKLEKPPRLTIEKRVSDDRFYQFLDKTMFAQQVPWAVLFFIIGGLPWLVWGIAVRVALSLLGHWLIGYFAHNSGPQNWHISDMNAQGHNVRFCSALTMGESFHNNHHAFPASARLGLYKGEIDLGWLTLCGLQKLGLVWNIKTPSNLPTRNTLTALEPMMKKQPSDKASNLTGILPHITAGSLALVYAWSISKTEYVTTGLQFVMPLGIILATHTLWLRMAQQSTFWLCWLGIIKNSTYRICWSVDHNGGSDFRT
ncbi:DNA polymerase IV [Nymphon striatum]|nr:DNA polymerase IV [Nymphon striatum]